MGEGVTQPTLGQGVGQKQLGRAMVKLANFNQTSYIIGRIL